MIRIYARRFSLLLISFTILKLYSTVFLLFVINNSVAQSCMQDISFLYKIDPTLDFVWLNDDGVIKTKALDQAQFDTLCVYFEANVNTAISQQYNKVTLYNTNNKNYYILLYRFPNGDDFNKYRFFFTWDDCLRFLTQGGIEEGVLPLLIGKHNASRDFPNLTPVYIQELLDYFKITTITALDEQLLLQIDTLLNSMDIEEGYRIKHKFFLNFIALVGEVYRNKYKKYSPQWYIKERKVGNYVTIEPLLKVKGHIIQNHIGYLYEDLFIRSYNNLFHEFEDYYVENPLSNSYLSLQDITQFSLGLK